MTTRADTLLDDLTDAQRTAVTHRDGALLVLAGPGSGKTTVVTRRIACLIAGGVAPWQILALTFTNKAAGEMRRRVDALLPGDLLADGAPTVSTFHSFCARQLRRYAEAADLAPRFSIYDESDRREAIKRAVEEAGLSTKNWTPAAMVAAISDAKNRLLDAEGYRAAARDFYTRTVAGVYGSYERIMRANDAVDFDDLLLVMVRMLRESAEVRERLQRRYRYLLVDEYQDTNHAQFAIAHTLAAEHGNICVVGDPDQSIYGWRGADIANILEFEEHHRDAAIVPLGRNFRSTGHIVEAAAGLIANNRRRKHKRLFTELGDGERPQVAVCRDEHHEAELVANQLRRAHDDAGVPWKEMAVLYRINALSRVLEEAMRNARIPYVIARGTAFYDRKEIRDALAYLRLMINPNDEVALRRIVNTPPRGIGKTTFEKIERFALDGRLTIAEAMRQTGEIDGLTSRATGAVGRFVRLLESLRRSAEEGLGGLAALVDQVIRDSGLEKMYQTAADEDRERLENLDELVSAAADFVPPPEDAAGGDEADESLPARLAAFMESVALVSDADAIDPASGTVTLMTLHAAKGLEFSLVALVGLEEGLLPHARAFDSDQELEEERRLCFVGMTRARRTLMLSRAGMRAHRGVPMAAIESRFLRELPRASVAWCDHSGVWADGDLGRDDIRRADARLVSSFPVGCIVRHPEYGLGRVEEIEPRASGAAARVAFPTAGTKTLILDHAPLVRVG